MWSLTILCFLLPPPYMIYDNLLFLYQTDYFNSANDSKLLYFSISETSGTPVNSLVTLIGKEGDRFHCWLKKQ